MRHRVSGYKLGRKSWSRNALYRILVYECIKRGKIRTTMAKAKAVQPKIEKLITLGRKGSQNDRKKAYSFVNNVEITDELFNVIGKKFEKRDSGFTRITKLGIRKGDSSHMVELSILDDSSVEIKDDESEDE